MKLRVWVLLLLLANLGFFVWSQGALDGMLGLRAGGDREPERLARQFQPQTVRIVPPAEVGAVASGAEPACLEAGPYSQADAALAEGVLQLALPSGSWARRDVEQPGQWLVYLGRFASAEALQKKAEELRRLQAPVDDVQSPPELAPGLSLGRFDSRTAAEQVLAQWTQRGLRGARVVTLSEPATMVALRVDRADPALAARVAAVSAEVKGQPLGKAFAACPK
jgi:hypothetical protein